MYSFLNLARLFAPTRLGNLLLVPGTPEATAIVFHTIFVYNASTRTCHLCEGWRRDPERRPLQTSDVPRSPLLYTHSSRSHIVVCGAIYVRAYSCRATCCRLGRVSMAGPARDFRCCHHRRPTGARVAMGCRS